VPVNELLLSLPSWKKPLGKLMLNGMVGKFDLAGAYNVEAARMIKPVMGSTPLFVVGGFRKVSQMEDVLAKGYADCISMSRPFIRQPFTVKRFKEKKDEEVSCISCNKCVAAVLMDMPVRCYQKGFPNK
jgi:2,4-dienoyl-CoA reductase-like NADH-dependent reductase (Old Yellow Enzyme family)